MIISLIIITLFLGGGAGLDLSDPAVLQRLEAQVANEISDPQRARVVLDSVITLERIDQAYRAEAQKRVGALIKSVGSPTATPQDLMAGMNELEALSLEENRKILAARERIRMSTDKKEWKKLLKAGKE